MSRNLDPRRRRSVSDGEPLSSGTDGENDEVRAEASPEYLRSIAVQLNNAGAEFHNAFVLDRDGGSADCDAESLEAAMGLFKESVSTMMDAGKQREEEQPQRKKNYLQEKVEMLVDAKMTVHRKRQGSKSKASSVKHRSSKPFRHELRDLMLFQPDSVLDRGTACCEEAIKAHQYDDRSSGSHKTRSKDSTPSVNVGSAAVFNMGLLQLRRSRVDDDDGLLDAAMKLFGMSLGVATAADKENGFAAERDEASPRHEQKRSLVSSATSIFRDQIYARTNLGHGLYARGSYEEAIEMFQQAVTKIESVSPSGRPAAEAALAGKEDVATIALLRLNLGRAHFARGDFCLATEACQAALQSVQAFQDANVEDAADLDALRTALTYNLAFLSHEGGRYKEALELFCSFLEDASDSHGSEAVTALSKILLIQMEGENDYEAVKELVDVLHHLEQAQDQVGYDHHGLCPILRCVGSALMERGENNFAVRYFLEALRIEQDHASSSAGEGEESGGTPRLGQEVAVTLNSIGECYHMADDLERASEFYESALELHQGQDRSDDAMDDNNGDEEKESRLKFIFSVVMYNNGRVKYELGRPEAAAALFGSSAALVAEVSSTFTDPARLSECASLRHNIGQYKLELGRTSDARACFEASLSLRRTVLGHDDPAVAESLYQLGKLLHGVGDDAAALGAFRESLRIERLAFGDAHPNVAMTLYNMAQIRYSACELDVALTMFQQVLEMLTTADPGDDDSSLSLGEVHGLIGAIQGELGLVGEARVSLAASARHGGGNRVTNENLMCASSLVEMASSRPAAAA